MLTSVFAKMTGSLAAARNSRRKPNRRRQAGRSRPKLVPQVETLESRTLPATWTPLANLAPTASGGTGTMMLLTDGRVIVQGGGVTNNWYALTPSGTGSYISGTSATPAAMS